jgi:glutamate-1-semialdehyde aminotransferase
VVITGGTIGIWPLTSDKGPRLTAICYRAYRLVGCRTGLQGTAQAFRYNDLAGLQQIMIGHRDQIAAIVMEPLRSNRPQPGFLEGRAGSC